jgi:transcriptional regulator with XRE-family HTH domain
MAKRSPTHLALGQAIRDCRAKLGITQEDLSRRSGLHRAYIGGVECGWRNPSFTNILKLADALEVRVSELFKRAERLQAAAK